MKTTPPQSSQITNPQRVSKRDSNLELYRIIVMLLIVAHHYVVNSGLFGMLAEGEFNVPTIVMLLFGAWGKTGINCFIMITGWFMCKSKFTVRKFIKLYLQIIFYAIIFYTIFCITGHEHFHPITAALKLFPIRSLHKGFVSCFMVFYLLIPFINVVIQNINKKQFKVLLIILLTVYTVLPTFPGYSLDFNYVSWFSLIYLIAAYIRFYNFGARLSYKKWGLIALMLIAISCITVIVLAYLGLNRYINSFVPYFFISDSNKFLALGIGVSSFMYFKDLKIPYSAFINAVGATTFGVLLIHANSDAMRQWLWRETVDCMGHFGESVLLTLGYAAVMVVVIFAVCSAIDWCRIKFIEPSYMKLVDRFMPSQLRN